MPTNYNRANLITESASLFPDNNTQEISPADLRQWLEDGTTSFVTQKDKSTLENAIFEAKGTTLPSGATVDLNTASGNFLHISGTSTITSFGTCTAGARFIIVFDGVATLTHNATSLIIPGGVNKTTAAGDCCMIVSEGSGNWRIVGYFAISGSGGGGGTVTSITAGTGLNGGTITTSGTIDLADTAVTPNSYTNANITVDAQGRITSASNGSPGGVTSVSATAPITSSGGSTPTISTSIATDKLVGRYSAGTGEMEEITIGSGLTLTGAGALNNTATPTPLGYYAMYQSLVTQTAAVSNTGYPMKFETMDLSNQVTVVNNGSGDPTRITFANAGVYNLQFSSQFQNTDNAQHDITIWLRLNGADVSGSAGFVQIPARKSAGVGNEGHLITSWNYLLDVSAGQYYEIVWSTSSAANVTMQFYAAGSPPPSTASVIFTVTQQSGIMAGTGITGIVGTSGSTQTGATQTFSSSDMTITSAANTHTFAIPNASDVAKGLVSISAQTFAGIKTFGNGVSAGEIRLLEPSGSGSNYVALKSQAITADYSITLPPAAPTGSQYLQSTGVGGVLQWTSGTTTGVSSIGTINSATKNPNGAVISGSNIIMQTADDTNVGLVSIGTQTFAGAKTFQAQVNIGNASYATAIQNFGGTTANRIVFPFNIAGLPLAQLTPGVGTRILIASSNFGSGATDYAIGYNTNEMWLAYPANLGGILSIYNNVTRIARFGAVGSSTGLHLGETTTSGYLGFLGTTSNLINFGDGGVAAPTVTTIRSLGYKIVLKANLGNGTNDYGIGYNTDELWFAGGSNGGVGQVSFYLGSATPRVSIGLGFLNLVSGYAYRINATQVVGARVTGWGAPTGTINRAAFTTTASVLYNQAELTATIQALKAVITDLQTHGLIGT